MFGFRKSSKQQTREFATVESQRNGVIPEEFPEGPYGSDLNSLSLGKSTPWRQDQHPVSAFEYENRELHAGIARDYPGADDERDHSADDSADDGLMY